MSKQGNEQSQLVQSALQLPEHWATAKRLFPGLLISVTIGLAAAFLSRQYGGPLMLYALLLGIAFNFLQENPKARPGIEFASRTVLRFGVALLGARITSDQVVALGAEAVGTLAAGVALTILVGWLLARWLGLRSDHGLLSGGAVAICGASAALALSSIMPRHEASERNTILTVVGVTSLSTIAMVLYPMLVGFLGLGDREAGLLLGATIHDVAQVVGAGYMISPETGDTSTIAKLFRVAMLLPAVLCFGLIFGRAHKQEGRSLQLIPGFLIGFAVLVVANSVGAIPAFGREFMSNLSGSCLVTAIAALGVKTSLGRLSEVGWKPVIMMVAETVFLLGFMLSVLWLGLLDAGGAS